MLSEPTNPSEPPATTIAGHEAIPARASEYVTTSLTVALLAVSFCVISSLGCMMLYLGWRKESLCLAVVRCVGFLLLIAGMRLPWLSPVATTG